MKKEAEQLSSNDLQEVIGCFVLLLVLPGSVES